ncbi:hypothetical protein [Acidocella sp.]|uniref:hypothetical protein n=1 Tax=Acidocella sp. TaxID=50710 RepID=UPI002608EF8E|nr:hypothetical protein [Acidocella sp.]
MAFIVSVWPIFFGPANGGCGGFAAEFGLACDLLFCQHFSAAHFGGGRDAFLASLLAFCFAFGGIGLAVFALVGPILLRLTAAGVWMGQKMAVYLAFWYNQIFGLTIQFCSTPPPLGYYFVS